MNYKFLPFLFLLFFKFSAQTESNGKEKLQPQRIYLDMYHYTSTTIYSSGKSTRATGYRVRFKVGENAEFQKLGRNGKRLRKALANDQQALSQLDKAYKVHLRKKRIFNFLELTSKLALVGSMAPLIIGLDDYQNTGVTPLAVVGGVTLVAGLTGVFIFPKLTDKHMDLWANSVDASVRIYNENLKKMQ